MVDGEPNPLLLSARVWVAANRGILEACFRRFDAAGEWPLVEDLQHDFELAGGDVDVWAAAWNIPPPLGFVEQERLVLRVRGLTNVPAAAPLLEDWYSALRLAYHRWREAPASLLTRSDVQDLLDDDPRRTRMVTLLLLRESWAFGSGHGGPDDEWSRELHSSVRVARSARDAAEIVEARDAVEYPEVPPHPRSPQKRFVGRVWRLINDNPVIAAIVAAVLLAGGGAGIKALLDHLGSGSTTPGTTGTSRPPEGERPQASPEPPGRRERAGSAGARAFADPGTLSGQGVGVRPYQYVVVRCKLYSPDPPSVRPDGYWYRLSSNPWKGNFYAPANSFWNGDTPGHEPYTHNTDFAVPDC